MTEIYSEEASAWLERTGYGSQTPFPINSVEFPFPRDSGAKVFLARLIAGRIGTARSLLAVTDIGIWESSSNPFVFEKFISTAGINRTIMWDDRVFLLTDEGDAEYAEGIIALSLLFIYGGFFARENGELIIGWSHDEFIYVGSAPNKKGVELQQTLKELENAVSG